MNKFLRIALIPALITLGVTSCEINITNPDGSTNTGNSNNSTGNSPAPATTAPTLNAKAGFVTGQVVNASGQPFTVANSLSSVTVRGTSTFGERQVLNPPVASDGKFEIQVPDGTYSVEGRTKILYEGKEYSIPLESSAPDPISSANGITATMVVKISGPKKGELNKFHGGALNFNYYGGNDLKTFPYPNNTNIKFILTPVSLIDGSTGKVLNFERTVGALRENYTFNDVPIGKYSVSGKAILADASEKTLVFYDSASQKYIPDFQFTFAPALTSLDAVNSVTIQAYHPVN